MFDVDQLIEDCQKAVATEGDAQGAVRDLLARLVERPGDVAEVLGKDEGGLEVLYNAPDLTVLNVIWAPGFTIMPHDHRMWANIAVYGGVEDNTLYKRGPERIKAAGGRLLEAGDVFSLGAEAIHHVANPARKFTGAIHVYGGDHVNTPRSQWDPDSLLEQPYDFVEVQRLFAAANEEWRNQLGTDIDESAG